MRLISRAPLNRTDTWPPWQLCWTCPMDSHVLSPLVPSRLGAGMRGLAIRLCHEPPYPRWFKWLELTLLRSGEVYFGFQPVLSPQVPSLSSASQCRHWFLRPPAMGFALDTYCGLSQVLSPQVPSLTGARLGRLRSDISAPAMGFALVTHHGLSQVLSHLVPSLPSARTCGLRHVAVLLPLRHVFRAACVKWVVTSAVTISVITAKVWGCAI